MILLPSTVQYAVVASGVLPRVTLSGRLQTVEFFRALATVHIYHYVFGIIVLSTPSSLLHMHRSLPTHVIGYCDASQHKVTRGVCVWGGGGG